MVRSIPGVLTVTEPTGPNVPVIFDSPHSGADSPDDFGSILPLSALRVTEDAFVDQLYAAAPENGAVLLAALFPRCFVDPNRSSVDLDPSSLDGPWPEPLVPSEKTLHLGSGLIWCTCYPDIPMYDRKFTVAEVRRRIDTFYKPYHAAVVGAIEAAHQQFSQAWHVNCHSMPSFSTAKSPEGPGNERPEFVLGDRDGTTADPEFTALVRETLAGFGYEVTVNDPYKGAELVRAYSNPSAGRHSLQIEIKRALYMNETTIQPNAGFEALRANITRLVEVICAYAASKT